MRGKQKNEIRKRAFTLIELLIVILIVGILATIAIVSYGNMKERAKAAKMAADLKQIETAFHLWATSEGVSSWWQEDVWKAPTDEPTLDWLSKNTSLKEWLPSALNVDNNLYVYDNDLDTFDTSVNNCANGVIYAGVNLNIWDPTLISSAEALDKQIDNGDGPKCGKLVWDKTGTDGNFIGYKLGNNSSDL